MLEHKNNGQESKSISIPHWSYFSLQSFCCHSLPWFCLPLQQQQLYTLKLWTPIPCWSHPTGSTSIVAENTQSHIHWPISVISWPLLTRASDWSNMCMEHCRINLQLLATVGILSELCTGCTIDWLLGMQNCMVMCVVPHTIATIAVQLGHIIQMEFWLLWKCSDLHEDLV